MPAWYVHCWYFSDPQKEVDDYEAEDVPPEGIIEYGALVFDAQTGQMLDRFGRDSTVGDYDGFLSWNAVGG